ncbi:17163_t:CDS:2, partial [Dentiscutata heterogama]
DLRDVIKDLKGRNLDKNQNGIVKYFKGVYNQDLSEYKTSKERDLIKNINSFIVKIEFDLFINVKHDYDEVIENKGDDLFSKEDYRKIYYEYNNNVFNSVNFGNYLIISFDNVGDHVKYYMLDDIEDFKDPETDEYLVKVKVAEVKSFRIIAIVLVNNEFSIKYENPNEDLIDLIEVKTEADFLKTMFQVYKNFSPDRESGWNTLGYD